MKEDHEIIELYWARSESAVHETDEKYGAKLHTLSGRIRQEEEDRLVNSAEQYDVTLPMDTDCGSYHPITLVQRDLARGHRYDWALVEYGGNDCNYDWPDVAAHPEQDHDPVVLVDEFRANMAAIVQMLREAGIRPIFTTLPPIDEVKYLACIDHNGASAAGVMQWLGDVRRIYRTQERYSGLVRTIAAGLDVPCVDPRERFLDGVDPRVSNAEDGIHLSEAGYRMFYATLIEQVRAII